MASALVRGSQHINMFLTEFGSDVADVHSAVGKANPAFFDMVLMCDVPDGCGLKK